MDSSGNSDLKLNGEKSSIDDNNENSNVLDLSTKEPILNGAEDINVKVVNGDPKNILECDISISNAKVVSNGMNNDSDNTKSSKSDESNDIVLNPELNLPVFDTKSVNCKKKDNKKNILIEKNKEVEVINSKLKNSLDEKKDEDSLKKADKDKDKTDDEISKVVNGDKERESSPSEDGDEKKRDAEVVFIQDMGFTVKIVSPRAEPLDIQVSSMELVQEIHQVLMDREDTCHRTCFSLQLDGATLDNFAELKNIEGLKEGSVIKVFVL